MKVGFIHPGQPLGEGTGAIHSASEIVFRLAERGHTVTVYCMEEPPSEYDVPPNVSLRSLDLSGFPYQSGLQLDRALRDRLSEFDEYDIVHSYTMDAIPALGGIATETSASTVVTLNAYGAICPKHDLRYMDRETCTSNGTAKCAACSLATCGGHAQHGRTYRFAGRMGSLKLVRESAKVADRIDGYHALSSHIKATYTDFGYPRDRIRVVPNILNDRFCREHESDFTPPYELLYVGELADHKGVDRLLPILDALHRQSSADFRLTIVGDGGLASTVKQQLTAYELEPLVTVTGWLPNETLPSVFASHDLFVYPGRWDEPFGRVFVEALATGTPVVASDVGSIAGIIGAGGTTTDGSIDGFVGSILSMIRRGELTNRSSSARQHVERYRAETVVPKLIDLYRDSLER